MKRHETTDISTADVAMIDQDRRGRDSGQEKPGTRRPSGPDEPLAPLFPPDKASELRDNWNHLQAEFVDDPRRTVKQADELVARVMKDLAANFAEERSRLESQWSRGDQVSTEELRLALRRYRSFFERFLSV
jgi:hypothetical protein